jgi:hypothetical protein|tara:strand:- start:704 stop:1033 length:330 start_codon:yes stop_codon:yes gene_type:complete
MNEPRECEVCLKEFDLDTEGFLNILEICEADDKVIEDYETENKINLQNYFCDDCTDKTLRKIEEDQCVVCNRDVVFENWKGKELTEWEVDDKGDRYCPKCYQDKYGDGF